MRGMRDMQTIVVHCTGSAELKPLYASEHASGADLMADIPGPMTLQPLERACIPTGVFLEIPSGYEGQIRPRSGLALKYGITVLNSPGTIDSDYRGEVKVILVNLGNEPFVINSGDRIAQIVFSPVARASFIQKEELQISERGAGGFGSTGI
jgi:dUTP pyrophosphatase